MRRHLTTVCAFSSNAPGAVHFCLGIRVVICRPFGANSIAKTRLGGGFSWLGLGRVMLSN